MAPENKRQRRRQGGPGKPFPKGNKVGPRFQPGQSGNPGGRPKSFKEFTEAHRDMVPEAQAELRKMLASSDREDRRFAIRTIYARAFGREPLPLTNDDGTPGPTEADGLLALFMRLEQQAHGAAPQPAPPPAQPVEVTVQVNPSPAPPQLPQSEPKPKSGIAGKVAAALRAGRTQRPVDEEDEEDDES